MLSDVLGTTLQGDGWIWEIEGSVEDVWFERICGHFLYLNCHNVETSGQTHTILVGT